MNELDQLIEATLPATQHHHQLQQQPQQEVDEEEDWEAALQMSFDEW